MPLHFIKWRGRPAWSSEFRVQPGAAIRWPFLVEVADDTCYLIVDLEDAAKLGFVPYRDAELLLATSPAMRSAAAASIACTIPRSASNTCVPRPSADSWRVRQRFF
jgi:hypothetical protein